MTTAVTSPSQYPASRPPASPGPRFGLAGGIWADIGKNVAYDTATVLLPKTGADLIERGKMQIAENWYLEWLENVAFYGMVPVVGKLGLGKLFSGGNAKLYEAIGTALKNQIKPSNAVIGAKAGTVLGVMALALGWEYLVQHTKNWMTAVNFGAKNFTAVAGLEGKRKHVEAGQVDPVAKAKRRVKQVGVLTALALGLAAFTPALVRNSKTAESIARSALKIWDFSGNKAWDMSRVMLATIVGVGGISYLDAARDHLEFRETGLRLLAVMPNLVFGKALTAWGLGKLAQKIPVGKIPASKLKNLFLNPELWGKDSILGFKTWRDADDFKKNLNTLRFNKSTRAALQQRHWLIENFMTYAVSGLGMGGILTWLTYRSTHSKFAQQQQAKIAEAAAKANLARRERRIAIPTADSAFATGNPYGQFQYAYTPRQAYAAPVQRPAAATYRQGAS